MSGSPLIKIASSLYAVPTYRKISGVASKMSKNFDFIPGRTKKSLYFQQVGIAEARFVFVFRNGRNSIKNEFFQPIVKAGL
jgi:hypothetical protein